jgi:hypothetical protein
VYKVTVSFPFCDFILIKLCVPDGQFEYESTNIADEEYGKYKDPDDTTIFDLVIPEPDMFKLLIVEYNEFKEPLDK